MSRQPHERPAGRRLRPARRHPFHRRRRLRATVAILAGLALAGSAFGVLLYRWNRTDVYRPGEELPEITARLSRGLPAEAPWPRFADVTAEAGLADFRTFSGQRTSQLPEDMGSGLAWGDFDGDGDDDLFLVAAGGPMNAPPEAWARSRLYENRGDGTFRPVESFPELRVLGMAAAWGDADGDGRLDLVVSGYHTLRLFRHRGGELVRDESFPEPEGYWAGAAWGDFDGDRDLDLYVCGYVRYDEAAARARHLSEQYGKAVPFTLNPASFPSERNLLLRNDGDGRFTEVAEALGVSNPEGRSLGALWHDFDDDGRLDLYVANDISDNVLYLNRGGSFEDVSHAAFVADYRGAMGLAAGDWNRDGDDDLFITHWVAQENALYDSMLRDLAQVEAEAGKGADARAAEFGAGGLGFSDRAAPLGLGQSALRFIGWGTEFADFDGDGWLDLVVANGSTFESEGEPRRLVAQEPMLLWNQQGEFFHDLAPLSDVLSLPHVGRGLALSDYDSDGDLDVAILHHGEGVQLLRNDMQEGHWLELRLRSRLPTGAWSRGEGATVVARVGDVELRRAVGSSSYLSQSSRTLHFGLGDHEAVDSVEVRWLGGETELYPRLEADAIWELTEGDPVPRRTVSRPLDERERVTAFWTLQRQAMRALQQDDDPRRAAALFRQALDLDPRHGDARYYLANALARLGHLDEALAHLEELRRLDPQSHRAHKQWGTLRALHARSESELDEAAGALERALELNREETGALQVLAEIDLLRGGTARAAERLEWISRTHAQAEGALFLRAYLAWEDGDAAEARRLLADARDARGPDWKPEGAVAEGDVERRVHREETPLSRTWEGWDGSPEPATAFAALRERLRSPY